jgi:HEAT repeat protein
MMRIILPASLIVVASALATRGEEPHTFLGKTAEGWLAILRDNASTEARRREAVVMLGCFGPEARAAAPDLIEAVRKGPFRDEAVDALVSIGVGAEVTVPVLIDRFVKRGCQHLTGMGSFPYVPSLDRALARVGEPTVPALLKILNGPDAGLPVCAAYALGEIGPAARVAVPALIRAVEHPDPGREAAILVGHAIRALGRIGPGANAAIPALNRQLDRWSHDYVDAVIALDRIGAPPVRKLLDTFLREGDPNVADPLAWLALKAREAAPALRSALTDKRLPVRISAAVALAHIDPSATESIPILIEGLKHREDRDLDVASVPNALARLGPKARAAMPILTGMVSDEPADTDILLDMVAIDPAGKECVPALIAALKSEEPVVADAAADCLSLLGPNAKDAIPTLAATVTRDFNWDFANGHHPQASAAKALRRVDPPGTVAIPALIPALKYRHGVAGGFADCDAAGVAAEILGSYGTRAREAIPALIEVLHSREKDDDDWTVRLAAAQALGQIRPGAEVAIPVLRDLVNKDDPGSPYEAQATIALYQTAPDGKELAERWLRKPVRARESRGLLRELEDRAMVLGAMGRASLESDWVVRHYLDQLDWMLAHSDPGGGGPYKYLESWLEIFGRFGTAGRPAIPRLKELCNHPSPFARMWAPEALEQITPQK